MQLLRPLSWPAARRLDRLNGIDGGFHHLDIMDIGRREGDGQRDAVAIDQKMALRPRFAMIRRIRPGRFAPQGPEPEPNPARPRTNRCCPLRQADLTTPGGAASRPRPVASGAIVASRSSHCRSPFLWGASPRESPSSGQRGSRLAPSGPEWVVFPLLASALAAAGGLG